MPVRLIVTNVWYVLISLIMITVNSFTIYVIAQTRKLRQRACNIFYLNLALADILIGLDIGVTVSLVIFQFPYEESDVVCKLEWIIYLVFLQASVLFTLAISFDRFAFIRWPFLYRKHVTPRASWRLVGFVWLLSLLVGCSTCLSPTIHQGYHCEEFLASIWVHIIGHIVYLSIALCFLLSVYFYFSLLGIVRHQRRKHSYLSRMFQTELSTMAKHPVRSLRTVGGVDENPEYDNVARRKIDDYDKIMDSRLNERHTEIEDVVEEEDGCQKCFPEIQAIQRPEASQCKNVDVIVVSHLNLRQQHLELQATFDAPNEATFRSENHFDHAVAESQAAQLRKDDGLNNAEAARRFSYALHDVVRNSWNPSTPEGASTCSKFPGDAYTLKIYYNLPCSKNKRTKRNPALYEFRDDIQLKTLTHALDNVESKSKAQSTSVINELKTEHGTANNHLVVDNTFEVFVTLIQTTQSRFLEKECNDTDDVYSNNSFMSPSPMSSTKERTCYTRRASLNSKWSVSSHCNRQVNANHGWKGEERNKKCYFHNLSFHSKPSSFQGSGSTIQTIFKSPHSEMGAASQHKMHCCFHSFDDIRDKEPSTFVFSMNDETSSKCSHKCAYSVRKRSRDNVVPTTITSSLRDRAQETAKLHHQSDKRKGNKDAKTQSVSKDIRVARRLFVMFGVFAVCWMPFIIIHFVIHKFRLPGFIEHSIAFIGLSNSVFNFFVYPLSTKSFRNAMRKTIPICKKIIPKNWEN